MSDKTPLMRAVERTEWCHVVRIMRDFDSSVMREHTPRMAEAYWWSIEALNEAARELCEPSLVHLLDEIDQWQCSLQDILEGGE